MFSLWHPEQSVSILKVTCRNAALEKNILKKNEIRLVKFNSVHICRVRWECCLSSFVKRWYQVVHFTVSPLPQWNLHSARLPESYFWYASSQDVTKHPPMPRSPSHYKMHQYVLNIHPHRLLLTMGNWCLIIGDFATWQTHFCLCASSIVPNKHSWDVIMSSCQRSTSVWEGAWSRKRQMDQM